MNHTLRLARRLVFDLEFSIIPVWRPDATHSGKEPLVPWREYQTRRPTDAELLRWFSPYRKGGVANRVLTTGDLKIDIRGDGGYCVGPTSVHRSGDTYLECGDWSRARTTVPVFDASWLSDVGLLPVLPCPAPLPERPAGRRVGGDVVARARKYLAATPCPPIGSGSDAATFGAAARLVRGFALSDDQALALLVEWALHAGHDWDQHWLASKVASARRHGTEVIGGLLR